MTISRLSAGNGYAYYTSVTASADQRRGKGELGDYYLDTGTPPGQWMGRGAAVLGVDGQVTEEQMRALFGDGLHPNADEQIAVLIRQGFGAKQAIAAVRLGREFARYNSTEANELDTAITAEMTQRAAQLGRALTSDEAQAVRMRQAGILFRERHGRAGARHEVARFMTQELTKGHQPVAGFDLTFSAPKSVSVAWAVADPAGAAALEAAHQNAIETTIKWLEEEVIHTRSGAGGIALHKTTGLIATRFRHWESREGDPQLHDHVVISNRVQAIGQDKWRTIDSKSLYKATVNASTVYDRALADELKTLGLELRERVTPSGKFHAMELAVVSDRQLEQFSSRTIAIEARTRELTADYVAQHGRHPSTKELLALRQQATLETRTPKSQAVTRDDLRQQWRAQMGDGTDAVRRRIETAAVGPRLALPDGSVTVDVDDVARRIIDEVSSRRSTWTRNHVETRINIWAASQPQIIGQELRAQITTAALERASFPVTPVVELPRNDETVNPDGTSVYFAPWRDQYTSIAVLEAEDALLRAAQEVALPAVTEAVFEAAVVTHDGPLDAGQVDLAHQVACSENVLTVGIGPAGAGKTTAMKLAIAAVQGAGLHAHGVTVSAAAAEQLQQATGMPSSTIAKWLLDIENGNRGVAAGDVIVVDEAGMASARDLAQITQIATQAGAFVRLVGDDRQLQAIGAGGAVRMLAAEVGAVRLDQVHRFHDAEEAAASLQLREHGDVDWYITNRRIHGGNVAKVMGNIVDGWAADEAAGRSSLMMAGTNHEIATLNVMAQERRVANGSVDLAAGAVELADGNRAGIGDRIVTRRNDRRMTLDRGQGFVKNGDLWTVVDILDDGAARVVDPLGRGVVLPAEYVAANTGLGYATTVHRAQGQTVDNARILITNTTSRESLYVGLTRGRATNEVYAITDGASAVEQVRRAAANVSQAVSARELIAEAQRETSHPAALVRILRDMQQRADQHRYTAAIRRELPQMAGLLVESDKRDRLYAAIARAEDAGFSPARILQLAGTELPERGGDPTGLIAWRINRHLATAVERRGQEQRRPLRDVSDVQLADLLERANDHKDNARSAIGDALRASRNTKPSPAVDDAERPVQPVVDDATLDRLLALSAAAAAFYASQYPGSGAAAYITERFGSDLTEHDFGVGYAPAGWDALTQHLRDHMGATDTELVDAGLARVSKRGSLIDVFRDRVTFALRNADGQIVGFTARCNPDIDDPKTPKYINTPATPIFTKGEVLYGLTEGREALAAGAIPVRVEGPMDAIAVTLAGGGNAVGVAPMGTALTATQGELIAAASTSGIVLSALDLDKAGQAAAVKDFRTYSALGLDARELMLVNQVTDEPIKDPADAYRIDPTSLGLALTLPEIAPSMAAQVIRHRLQSDPHIAEHAGAQIRAARDVGATLAGVPLERIVAEIDSAAAAIAHYAGTDDAVGDFRRTITEAALRRRSGWGVDQDPDVAIQQRVVDDVAQLRGTLDGHPARGDYDQVLDQLRAQLESPGSAVAWSTRRHGALADEQLTAQLHQARATTRTLDGAIAEARDALRELRVEQRLATVTGAYATALQGRADRLARHVDRLHDDRNHQLKTAAGLHSEIQLRQRLTSEQWVTEQAGRDAARLSSGTAVSVDEARQRWRNASEVQRNLWLEQRARTFDTDPGINKRPAGTPAWAVPGRGTGDPSTPTSWRPVLDDMADRVAAAITDRGAAIALDPPTWATRYLGDVPDDQALRNRWERLAGQIETWRGLTDHQDPVKALPTPSRSHDASRTPETHLHTLHAAASDLRRDILNARLDELRSSLEQRDPRPPTGPRPEPSIDHLQAAALESHRARAAAPTAVVNEVRRRAPALSPADVDQAREQIDALQRRVASIHVDAHTQRAAQLSRVVDQTAARLDELRLAPLADGESGLDRIADADKVRADLAAAQQRAAAHTERGPRTTEQILGSLRRNVAALADGVKAARQHAVDQRQDRAIAASLERLDALEARGREPGVAPIEVLQPWAQEKTRLEQLLAARHPGQDLKTLLDQHRPGRRPHAQGPTAGTPADEIRRIAAQQSQQQQRPAAPARDRGRDDHER